VLAGAFLLALAGLSYGVSFLQLGSFNLPVALAIAVAKALTVLSVFMDFGSLSASAKLAAAAALLMVALLVGLMVADVATRELAPLPAPTHALRKDDAVRFPFFWKQTQRWEGRDFEVRIGGTR